MRSPGDRANARAGRLDDAGRLHARHAGRRQQVEIAGAAIDVDEVDADRRVADQHFARCWSRQRHLLELEHFRAAIALDDDGARCGERTAKAERNPAGCLEARLGGAAPPLRRASRDTSPPARGRGRVPSGVQALPLPRRSGERWSAQPTGVGVDHCGRRTSCGSPRSRRGRRRRAPAPSAPRGDARADGIPSAIPRTCASPSVTGFRRIVAT